MRWLPCRATRGAAPHCLSAACARPRLSSVRTRLGSWARLPVEHQPPHRIARPTGAWLATAAGSLDRQEQVAVETEEVLAPEPSQIGRPCLHLGLGHAAMARDESGDELDHPCAECL